MTSLWKPLLVGLIAFCGVLTVVVAASPTAKNASSGNSYYLFTKALHVDDLGVVAVPSRFKWSVETSFSGVDVQGNNLPDSRVMLRLYDPDQDFTVLTAQMDMATAARLHHELGEIIVKKLKPCSVVRARDDEASLRVQRYPLPSARRRSTIRRRQLD